MILHIQGKAWRGDIKTERGGGGGVDRDRGRQGDRRKEGEKDRQKERDRGNPNSKTLFSKEYSFG